ncbi:taste receptor type 2 member 14-like [Otolemur garnettii]|uniref:taste receptor type 2 member 14-like n=1 Tax=Otolemur garnettii TaxID=30611 RepID=UPI0002741CEB|nr:taste receptor type 2 member 14-like [Otolemur garnettii]
MSSVINNILSLILTVEFITGILGNGFIALVNCVDWAKRRKIALADQILTALAISRTGLLWLLSLSWYVSNYYPTLFSTEKTYRTVAFSWVVANHFSIWFATNLSVFYFLRITHFSNSVFLYLKGRVKKVMSVMFLVTTVILFFNITLVNVHINAWINGCKRNMTCFSDLNKLVRFSSHVLVTNTMFTFIPFTLSLTTFILIIFSLWKHVKRMQRGAKTFGDANIMVHIKAMQAVIAFLLLYTIFMLSYFLPLWRSHGQKENIFNKFCYTLGIVYPSGHSCLLILQNSKLRQASLSVLWWLRCRSKDGEPSGHLPFRESS